MERRRAVRRPAQRPSNASPSWTNQTVPQLVTGEPLVWALVQPTRRRSCGVAERRNACRIVSRPRLYRKPYTAAARRAPGQTSRSPFRYVRDSRTSIGLHRDVSFSVHPCHPKTEHLANVPHRGSNTNCGASSDHDVNNNIHKTQPRRSTLVRVALVLPPARILREYDPGTYRSRAAVASSLAPRDNFFSARHRLRFLSAPPCTVASGESETTGLEWWL